MHATGLLLAPLAALALGARGASVHRPRQSDPHVVDFRTFGLPGCDEQNQGVYTYLQSDLGTCFPFSTTDVVESIFVTDINAGCSGEFVVVSTLVVSPCPSLLYETPLPHWFGRRSASGWTTGGGRERVPPGERGGGRQ